MSAACSSTFRCRDTAGIEMGKGAVSSVTVASRSASSARIARRVGSASAENTALSWSVPDTRASSHLTNLLNVVQGERLSTCAFAAPISGGRLASGRARDDLGNPLRSASMYETVRREATSPDDLARWLDGPTVVRLGKPGSPAHGRPPGRGVVAGSTAPIHRRLAEIGLRAGRPFSFALAGGHAQAPT